MPYASKYGKHKNGHQIGKNQFTSPYQKKGNAKECSNFCTVALISHASKVMFKILQGRLQQYTERELPDVQAGFRKGRGTRDQIANIHWIMEEAREFQKNIYFCFIDYSKAFDCVDHNKLWHVLGGMGIPSHLVCLLRNLQRPSSHSKNRPRNNRLVQDWERSAAGLYTIALPIQLDESKAGVKISGRNINNLRYADDTTLMAENEEELRSLITKVKEECAKAGLQLNIKKTKIMATRPIDNWQIEGENVEAVTDFIFLGAKITADADCSQEIRRRLLLGRRAMANLDKILKSRDITLATKVRIVKAMVFPIATYGCESWTIRKAERKKIDAFELWCWRKILRVPWTARRSNQSILQEIMPDCSLEGRILEAKLKYFGHIMRRQESLEKIMMLGKMKGKRKRGRPRARWMDGILEVTGSTLKELGAVTADGELWCGLVHEVTKSRKRLNE
uniref:Reverse transcriptase domain-containing protein n=1 Tax=Anolis carolinensis TaxID=28377 RepID=A0A803T8A9_ANOCA